MLDDEKELPPPGHPLNALATRLGELLDEDHWAECEALLLKACAARAKERAAALEDVERWKRAAESNIEENVGLRLAEEGAKEAFGHVVQQKRDLDAECKRLRGLLDLAYDTIRRKSHNLRFEELKYRSRA